MKFIILLKKEIKEMMTLQTIISLLISVIVFLFIGKIMNNANITIEKNTNKLYIQDEDNSNTSNSIINFLAQSGYQINKINDIKESPSNLIIIPKGLEKGLLEKKVQVLEIVSNIKSFSLISSASNKSSLVAVELINNLISDNLIKENIEAENTNYIKNPITFKQTTTFQDKSLSISPDIISSFASSQAFFIPIIIFILITFASQMTSSTIASEKGDKTLETLLATPISRLSVLIAKMSAAGAVSLLMAISNIIGLSYYVNNIGISAAPGNISNTSSTGASEYLKQLGMNLTYSDYILLGVQLFLTILIALSISIILGALSRDTKSAQTNIAPLMFLALIPYILTMFIDINSLPNIIKVLVYAIPFSHTFTASSNLIFNNYQLFFIGIIYQIIILVILLFIAVKIFSSDVIFTLSLNIKRKKNHS